MVTCGYCQRQHPHVRALRKHLNRVHAADLPIACPYCERRFSTVRAMNTHAGWAHPERYTNARNNPEVQRAWNLKRYYGMSAERYEQMFEAQGGACAVCSRPGGGTSRSDRLYVDHNHETGAVRGLLCLFCNMALGQLGEDADRIRQLADYIEGS